MPRIKLLPLFAICLCVFAASAAAQNKPPASGMIVGRITESSTGQPVAGATISIKDTANATSDEDGNYRLELRPGIYSVSIKATGFSPIVREQVGVTGGRTLRLDIQLDVTLSANVEVKSSVFAENVEQSVSNVTLDREVMRQTPGSGGDPLRAINSLPSVSAASAEFADLIVRGGGTDENLIFIDRIPVDDFTYFTDKYDSRGGGRASILAPDVFEKTEFSAGGFGARYGDRMSSVLDVSLREPARERIQAVAFLDSGTAGGTLDVPLGKRGSWMISGRRSYIDVALEIAQIADLGVIGYPATYDMTSKIVYDLTPKHKLSFTAMNFLEIFEQDDTQASNIGRRTDRLAGRRTSRRFVAGATLSSTFASNTLAQTTVFATGAHNDAAFLIPGSTFLQRSRDLRDSRFGIKEDVTFVPRKKVEFSFGGGLTVDQAKYRNFENVGTFYSPLEEEYSAPARNGLLDLRSTASAYGYAQATIRMAPALTVTPGIRVDHYGVTGETFASPRIGARFNAAETVALTFAAGIYRQPPAMFTMSLHQQNRDLKTQTSSHVIGGIEWMINPNTRLRVEGFHKNYSDLAIRPVRPTQNYVFDGRYFSTGRGTADGLELSLQKSLSGWFAGQASYSFLRSRRSFDANSPLAPSDLERPHQLVLIGITKLYGVAIGAKYRLASGLPYTPRTGIAITGTPYFFQRIVSTDDVNSLRLKDFASLDIRAERRFAFRRWSIAPYIDYFNITNHDSDVQVDYEFYRRTPQFLSENKRFPIFGMRVEF